MSDPQHDLKVWFFNKTAPHGVKAKLAEASGFTATQISRMRNLEADDPKKRQSIPLPMIEKAAKFFGELPPGFEGMTQWLDDQDALQGLDVVKVMGRIGAGAEIMPEFEQVPPEGLDQIQVPFPLPADMIAFEVQGDSMLPAYKDGHVVIVYREQKKPVTSFYGEEAAVRTADGRRFIKTIMRGSNGHVNLFSWNAAPIEDVMLEWIGEIFAVLPRSSLRHVAKQGGIQGRLKLGAAE